MIVQTGCDIQYSAGDRYIRIKVFYRISQGKQQFTTKLGKQLADPCPLGGLSGTDNSVLHIIRMHDRAKSISGVARHLNRDDISNLQYSLRKLTKAGLIERAGRNDSKRSATYKVTDEGTRVSELFAQFRRELLLSLTDSIKDFDADVSIASRILNITSGLYDHASAVAASHRHK